MPQMQLDVPVRDGYNFGVGADLLSGAVMNKPVSNAVVIDRLINNAMLRAKKGAVRIGSHSRAVWIARRVRRASS
jgi:hypothetical protein